MNILNFFVVFCTTYILVSGAPEFQHSADPWSLPRSSQWENIIHVENKDAIKRYRRQSWEPISNITNYEDQLLNEDIYSNSKYSKNNEDVAYRSNDEEAQPFSSQHDHSSLPPLYDYRRPSFSHYDHRPPPAPPPPTYDYKPPPSHYDPRPPPPPFDHRPLPPHYDHRPPFPHFDHRPPPPPHYNHGPPSPPRYHEEEPSPYEKRPPPDYYNKYNYNSGSTYRPPPPRPSSQYDDRQIRQTPYYDRSFNRDPPPPPRNERRPPPLQFDYDDRPPPPPQHDGRSPPAYTHPYQHSGDRGPPFHDNGRPPPPPHHDGRRPPPPHHDGGPPPPHHDRGPPPPHHDRGPPPQPHYDGGPPPPPYHDGRPPPPPDHDDRPPPRQDRPPSFHDESGRRSTPPRDRLLYNNRPDNEGTPPFDNRTRKNQEIMFGTSWENIILNRDSEEPATSDETQKKLTPIVNDNINSNRNDYAKLMSLIDVRFAEDNDKLSATLETESTTPNNSLTLEKYPKFTSLHFQAIPVTPEN